MFRLSSVAFLLGILMVIIINSISVYLYIFPMVCLTLAGVFWRYKFCRLLIGFSLGFIWVLMHLQFYATNQFPAELQKKPIRVIATVTSIPNRQPNLLSFTVKAQKLQNKVSHIKLKLNWYLYRKKTPNIQIGQKWQFTVKVKRPHSLMNPGSFDYLSWLVQEGISASGYIVKAKLLANSGLPSPIGTVRTNIKNNIQGILRGRPLSNFIVALTVGIRESISTAQWQILQNTGTNHLIAIAGLHIGLVTGLVFLLVSFIWKRLPILPLKLATPRIAATMALFVGWAYAALAGFSLPTERAVVMLTVFMASIIFRYLIAPWSAWCLALLVVLFLNPLSILSAGFWLSFIAVAWIIFIATGTIGAQNRWWRLAKVQFILALGLFPVTLLFFHNGSIIAPFANLLAIPIVGFLTVPLSLIGAMVSLCSLAWAKPILLLALLTLHWAWLILSYCSSQPWFSYQLNVEMWQVVAAMLSILLLALPRGIPGKYLAIIFILPLFVHSNPTPKKGALWMTELDVGQGLSIVLRTQKHTLVYDTGAKYSASYDMGKAVVVPFLQNRHIQHIDKIIISHGDNDHIGGLQSVLKIYPTQNILTSVPKQIKGSKTCLSDQHWRWDGVGFEILYPDKQHLGKDNNSSCVLRVTVGSKHVLLTGDIEKYAEQYLVKHDSKKLTADIIVAPHHGSKTSSTPAFINLVKPKFVVFPTGYLNRFHFPSKMVVARYKGLGSKLYNTASDGAVSFEISRQKKLFKPQSYCYTMNLVYFRHCLSHH